MYGDNEGWTLKDLKIKKAGTYSVGLKYIPKTGKSITIAKYSSWKVSKANVVKLTLNKVNIKQSAKKLNLKATLKINGKKIKGKKLTFKFNGKKYAAKTNKKGIAKVVIKQVVLKKLQIGDKIKYLVKYSSKTVKKTATVKK